MHPDGTLCACYRITRYGLREFRRLQGIEAVEEHFETTEQSQPRVARKNKDKNDPQSVANPE